MGDVGCSWGLFFGECGRRGQASPYHTVKVAATCYKLPGELGLAGVPTQQPRRRERQGETGRGVSFGRIGNEAARFRLGSGRLYGKILYE